jgi:hypothetical protein
VLKRAERQELHANIRAAPPPAMMPVADSAARLRNDGTTGAWCGI